MPIRIPILLLAFIFFIPADGISQENRPGAVADGQTLEPLPAATIKNLTRRVAVISSERGEFRITALPGDTLQVSYIGYFPHQLTVPDTGAAITIMLRKQIKRLDELTVTGKSGKPPKAGSSPPAGRILFEGAPELMGKELGDFGRMGYDYATLEPKMSVKGPISLLYDQFSREGKARRKLRRLLEADRIQAIYRQRMASHRITYLTGLSNDQATPFIAYCDFSEPFVVSAAEQDFLDALYQCLAAFRKAGKNR